MINKTINKNYLSFKSIFAYKYLDKIYKDKSGIIYTLYSEKLNLLEVGFTKSNRTLETILSDNKFILLDKKEGEYMDLNLVKETLKQLGLKLLDKKYYRFSNLTIRHLNLLGWPIGNSIYKQRKIRKLFF
tara:strand:- start:264 stop:653 length:390 start_codon:yes stop_codon:yes gene_type:complete